MSQIPETEPIAKDFILDNPESGLNVQNTRIVLKVAGFGVKYGVTNLFE